MKNGKLLDLSGILYLVTSDTTLEGNGITAIYQNVGTWNPITNRSNRMLLWRNHRRKRWSLRQIISLRLCTATSNSNCSKAIPNSITLHSNQNCICTLFNQPTLPCVNSTPLNWLRKVSKPIRETHTEPVEVFVAKECGQTPEALEICLFLLKAEEP